SLVLTGSGEVSTCAKTGEFEQAKAIAIAHENGNIAFVVNRMRSSSLQIFPRGKSVNFSLSKAADSPRFNPTSRELDRYGYSSPAPFAPGTGVAFVAGSHLASFCLTSANSDLPARFFHSSGSLASS